MSAANAAAQRTTGERTITRGESNLLYISALLLVGILVVVVVQQWRSLSESGPLLALMVLFALMILRLPDDGAAAWQVHLYLSIQTVIVILASTQSTVFVFLFFILSVQAMMLLPRQAGLRWIGVFAGVTIFANFYNNLDPGTAILNALVNSAGFLFFGVFGNALMRAERARVRSDQLLAELTDTHRRLQAYAEQVEGLAVAEERNRLSREMHDTLGHRLTASIVQLEGAQRLVGRDPEQAGQMIGTVREQLHAGLEDLRQTLRALRSPQITATTFPRMLQELAGAFERATGLHVQTQLPGGPVDLDEGRRLTLYRAAQEALTNVQRHARARTVCLRLEVTGAEIVLTVQDDGRGLDEVHLTPGIGLRGMQERAHQMGGTMRFGPAPGGGARLILRLPIGERVDHV